MSKIDIWKLHDFEKASDIDPSLVDENPSYGSAYADLTINGYSMDVGFNFENGKVTETSFDYDEEFLDEYDYKEAFNGESIESVSKEIKSAISDSFSADYSYAIKNISIKEINGTDYKYKGIEFSAIAGEGTDLETSISGNVYSGGIHNAKVDGSISLSDIEEDIVDVVQRGPFNDYPHVSSFEEIMLSTDEDNRDFDYPERQYVGNLKDFGMATAVFDNGMTARFTFNHLGVGYETDFENSVETFREDNADVVGDMSDSELEDLMVGMSENLSFEFYDFMKSDMQNNLSTEITGTSENKIYFQGFAGAELPGEFSGVAEVTKNGDLYIDPYEIEASGVLNPDLLAESYDLEACILFDVDICRIISNNIENIKNEGKYTTFDGHLDEPLDSFSFKGRMDNETKEVFIDKDVLLKPSISHSDIEDAIKRRDSFSKLKNEYNKSAKHDIEI